MLVRACRADASAMEFMDWLWCSVEWTWGKKDPARNPSSAVQVIGELYPSPRMVWGHCSPETYAAHARPDDLSPKSSMGSPAAQLGGKPPLNRGFKISVCCAKSSFPVFHEPGFNESRLRFVAFQKKRSPRLCMAYRTLSIASATDSAWKLPA